MMTSRRHRLRLALPVVDEVDEEEERVVDEVDEADETMIEVNAENEETTSNPDAADEDVDVVDVVDVKPRHSPKIYSLGQCNYPDAQTTRFRVLFTMSPLALLRATGGTSRSQARRPRSYMCS